jgi:hypothetical protein
MTCLSFGVFQMIIVLIILLKRIAWKYGRL